eukprot:jgi/Psemu1/54828/gm1.54828_g
MEFRTDENFIPLDKNHEGGDTYSAPDIILISPGVTNYSKTELIELLHTIRSILPIGPEQWNQVTQIHRDNFPDTDRTVPNLRGKYTNLYQKQMPTGDPNCPEEVKLAKKIRRLIYEKAGIGNGEEALDMEEGYINNNNNISSSEDEDEDSDDDILLPPIPLCQPLQVTESTQPTQPTQPNQPSPSNQSNHHHRYVSLPNKQLQRKKVPGIANGWLNAFVHIPPSPAVPQLMRLRSSSSSSTAGATKRQYKSSKVNGQEILALLRENSELEREQRRESRGKNDRP